MEKELEKNGMPQSPLDKIAELEKERVSRILAYFEKAGMKIEVGANFSVKGQIAQLVNAADAIFDECAEISDQVSRYHGVHGTIYEDLPRLIAGKIRIRKSI